MYVYTVNIRVEEEMEKATTASQPTTAIFYKAPSLSRQLVSQFHLG